MKSCRPVAVIVVAVLALAGCSSDDFSFSSIGEKIGLGDSSDSAKKNAPAVQLAPAPAPIYAAGDTFVYSNDGIVVQEQVVSATADRVTWTNDQGMIWTTSNDVVTPQLSWSSHPELGRGRQTIIGNAKALFPLQEGNVVAFGVRGNSETVPTGWRDEHRCAVLGQEDIEVSGGRFTTFHISCQRKDHIEELYYSPIVQNYVLRTRRFAATESRKELVSVALSDDRTKHMPVKVKRAEDAPKIASKMAHGKTSEKPMMAGKKTGDAMIAPGKPMAVKPSTGNPRVDALISRLEIMIARLEWMSGGGGTGMMVKSDDRGAKKAMAPKPSGAGGKYGAHLASYRTVAGARRGWRALRRKFPKELADLEFGTTEFDAGNGKGTYIRLVGLSFKSKAAVTKYCKPLKTKRQFCKATRVRP